MRGSEIERQGGPSVEGEGGTQRASDDREIERCDACEHAKRTHVQRKLALTWWCLAAPGPSGPPGEIRDQARVAAFAVSA